MLFSTSTFLFYFLPVFLLIYFLAPSFLKNLIILLASLLFYAWGENVLVLIMIASLTVDYFSALIIDRGYRKVGLVLSILFNLAFLGFFKYYDFFNEAAADLLGLIGINASPRLLKMALPLGISFYTFQSMSYTLDVYYGRVKASKNYLQFATYVTMFPQLVAGPIVRYVDIKEQLNNKDLSYTSFYSGLRRFILGLAKKMIIANNCGYIADNIWSSELTDLSTPIAWLGIIAYTFQIYFDFSGYSDMAIGLGRMLGFKFLENFNFPYISRSIREFWRRWHISCLLYTSPSPRDQRGSRMPSSA